MVKDDFFAPPAPVGGMVYGGAKAEHGLDDRFEKAAATTSAHSVLVCWGDSRPTKRSARFQSFPGRRRFFTRREKRVAKSCHGHVRRLQTA